MVDHMMIHKVILIVIVILIAYDGVNGNKNPLNAGYLTLVAWTLLIIDIVQVSIFTETTFLESLFLGVLAFFGTMFLGVIISSIYLKLSGESDSPNEDTEYHMNVLFNMIELGKSKDGNKVYYAYALIDEHVARYTAFVVKKYCPNIKIISKHNESKRLKEKQRAIEEMEDHLKLLKTINWKSYVENVDIPIFKERIDSHIESAITLNINQKILKKEHSFEEVKNHNGDNLKKELK